MTHTPISLCCCRCRSVSECAASSVGGLRVGGRVGRSLPQAGPVGVVGHLRKFCNTPGRCPIEHVTARTMAGTDSEVWGCGRATAGEVNQ